MKYKFLLLVCVFYLFVFSSVATQTASAQDKTEPDVVYVPTPNDVISKMLKAIKLKKSDVIFDLGCGDGRIVVTAATKYGCKGVGYEIDPVRLKECAANIKKHKVEKLVTIKNKDLFKADLSEASVIATYLLSEMNEKLIPQFQKMKKGSRIVTHEYHIPGIQEDEMLTVKSREDNEEHLIYVYTIPLKKAKDDS